MYVTNWQATDERWVNAREHFYSREQQNSRYKVVFKRLITWLLIGWIIKLLIFLISEKDFIYFLQIQFVEFVYHINTDAVYLPLVFISSVFLIEIINYRLSMDGKRFLLLYEDTFCVLYFTVYTVHTFSNKLLIITSSFFYKPTFI